MEEIKVILNTIISKRPRDIYLSSTKLDVFVLMKQTLLCKMNIIQLLPANNTRVRAQYRVKEMLGVLGYQL